MAGQAEVKEALEALTKKDFQSDQEVRWCPGCGDYSILSQMQKVMPELGIPRDIFQRSDIHLHVPAGAIPKDGPSAGVTIVTALVSLLSGRCVSEDVGMTGEITLRGQVLPVGGIKEKMLAAHRSGLTTVILPKRNEKDLEDVPDEVRDELDFVLVERIDQVLEAALCEPLPEWQKVVKETASGNGREEPQETDDIIVVEEETA